MRIIDIHPHVISADATRYPRAPLEGKQSKWSQEHTVGHEQMIAEMDGCGVEKSVLVQSSTCYGFDNSYVADAIAAHAGRLGGVCSIDALAPDAPQRLASWTSRGFLGVRLYVSGATVTNRATWFNDPDCFPFWNKAAELGLPVCLQTSWQSMPEVRETLRRYRNVKVILDHLMRPPVEDGAPYAGAAPLFELADYPNVFLKLTPVNLKDASKGPATPQGFVARLVQVFGAERIAWGSNFPSSTSTLKAAYDAGREGTQGLGESDKAFIFGKTALSLYPRLA